jgi:hypothetical protein
VSEQKKCRTIWQETKRADNGNSEVMRRGDAVGLRVVVTEFSHDGHIRYFTGLYRMNEYGCDTDDWKKIKEIVSAQYAPLTQQEAVRSAIQMMDEAMSEYAQYEAHK